MSDYHTSWLLRMRLSEGGPEYEEVRASAHRARARASLLVAAIAHVDEAHFTVVAPGDVPYQRAHWKRGDARLRWHAA